MVMGQALYVALLSKIKTQSCTSKKIFFFGPPEEKS